MRRTDAIESHASDECDDSLLEQFGVAASTAGPRLAGGLEVREPLLGELCDGDLHRDRVIASVEAAERLAHRLFRGLARREAGLPALPALLCLRIATDVDNKAP